MRVYQLIRVSGGRPTATSGHRTARRKRWDDLERIMRMVSSAIPIITFRYYPYKRKRLTFWVSLFFTIDEVIDEDIKNAASNLRQRFFVCVSFLERKVV